jgi:hypothetical protein
MSNNSSNSNSSTSSSTNGNEKPKLLYQEGNYSNSLKLLLTQTFELDKLLGETVLCYHGPLLYEAKVFKSN